MPLRPRNSSHVCIITYKLTGRPAHDGLAQVDYSGRRSGAFKLLCGSGAQYLRGQPRGLFCCGGSIILSSQTVAIEQPRLPRCRRLGRLSPGQSGPRMWSVTWSSTLQPSVRLGCRTALSRLRGMTSRPVPRQAHLRGLACRLCYCHFNQPKFERPSLVGISMFCILNTL